MEEEKDFVFEEIFQQNKRRIHYHIHKLHINDPHREYFQEGLCALWNAYEKHEPDKRPMATYFNFTIRNRLVDLMRKQKRDNDNTQQAVSEQKTQIDNGNHFRSKEATYPLVGFSDLPINDPTLWRNLKSELTENQWKWVRFYIMDDMAVKDIAIQENTTVDAVKSWGRQVRSKLRDAEFRKRIAFDV